MSTSFPVIGRTKPPYRVLTLDGGGIFGYFTSIMLKKLCKKYPEFLNGEDVVLFLRENRYYLCLSLRSYPQKVGEWRLDC